jgi:hypothetical protein
VSTQITTDNLYLAGPPNVRDFGAQMSGAQNDSPAFDAARASAQNTGGIIEIPAGRLSLWTGWPTSGANGVLWKNGSTDQLQFFGSTDDIIEGFVAGSKFFGMGQTRPGSPPVLRIDQRITHSHDTTGTVNQETVLPAFRVNQTTEAVRLDDFPWVLSVTSRTKSYGKGQAVGIGSQMIRELGSLNDGQGPRNQMWGAYIEVGDETQRPANESGSLVGLEMGIFATGGTPDNNTGGRFGIDIGIGRHSANGSGEANRVNRGINFGSADGQYDRPGGGKWTKAEHSYFGRVISVAANWDVAAFDTTDALALGGAPAIKLAEGHKVAFEASGSWTARYEAGALRFTSPNGETFNIDGGGNFNAAGAGRFPRLTLTGLPVSPVGLPSGTVWVDLNANNTLHVV